MIWRFSQKKEKEKKSDLGYKCPSDQVSLQTLYTLNETIAQPNHNPWLGRIVVSTSPQWQQQVQLYNRQQTPTLMLSQLGQVWRTRASI